MGNPYIQCIGCFISILYNMASKKKGHFGITVELTDIYRKTPWHHHAIMNGCCIVHLYTHVKGDGGMTYNLYIHPATAPLNV